jgi:mannan endo-1,6-alpha-mannosidase
LARWLGATAIIAPFTHDAIMAKLQTSAVAAAKTCIGGTHGTSCNSYWLGGATWPPIYGVGQQMAALEVIQANLIKTSVGPANNATGISQGNADAGADDPGTLIVFSPITTADRVEAVLLTIVSSLLACVTLWFLVVE